jgi:transposase
LTPLEIQLKEENELLHSRLNHLLQTFEEYKTQKEKEHKLLEERAHLLEEQVKVLLKRLYGSSSEKTKKEMDGQIVMEEVVRLFNEAEVFEEERKEEEVPSKTRKTKKGHRITDIFIDLPEREVLYQIPKEERVCSDCGGELQVVGIRHNRYEIEYIPSRVNLLNIKQETCSCPDCSKEKGETVFFEPRVPEPLLQHSYASPSSVAQVMYQKFVQGVPLYRQVKDWESKGVKLSRGTLSSWVVKTSLEWFTPLLDEFKRSLNQEEVLHADETPVQVLNEEGRKNEAKSYMWVLSSGSYSGHPVRYFEYAPSRSQEVAEQLLSGYRGYLVTDDYAGYNRLFDLRRCSCWAHYPRRTVIREDHANAAQPSIADIHLQ